MTELQKEFIDYYLTNYDPNRPYNKKYRDIDNKLYIAFKSIGDGGLYNMDIMQSILNLKVNKDSDLCLVEQEVNTVLPFIKDSVNDDLFDFPTKTISIFEYTLSEYRTFELNVSDSLYYITSYRHYTGSILCEFGTLREALEYIQKNHWYQEKSDDR